MSRITIKTIHIKGVIMLIGIIIGLVVGANVGLVIFSLMLSGKRKSN